MRELILSHNAFREVGGCILAPAIGMSGYILVSQI